MGKEIWLATNFTVKMLKEKGYQYRNKAVTIAANYYNVDEDDIKKELSIRQSKSQKGKKKGKFYWFVYIGKAVNESGYDGSDFDEFDIKVCGKALNAYNYITNKSSKWEIYGSQNQFSNHTYISLYSNDSLWNYDNNKDFTKVENTKYFVKGVLKTFDTKKEALSWLKDC